MWNPRHIVEGTTPERLDTRRADDRTGNPRSFPGRSRSLSSPRVSLPGSWNGHCPDHQCASFRQRTPTGERVEQIYLSIVVGCYNAGRKVTGDLLELLTFLEGLGRPYEILVVEDGSDDGTLVALRAMVAQCDSIRLLTNTRNRGKGYSIRKGIHHASGRYVIFTDVDMAYAKSDILTVLNELARGKPVVVGNRRLPESVYSANNTLVKYVYRRHLLGAAFNLLVRTLFGIDTRDTQSGLKGFHRKTALRIFHRVYTDGFLFDIEIFIRARKLGVQVAEVPVHVTFTDADSTVRLTRQLFRVLPDLLRIKVRELAGDYAVAEDAKELAVSPGKQSPHPPEEARRVRPHVSIREGASSDRRTVDA